MSNISKQCEFKPVPKVYMKALTGVNVISNDNKFKTVIIKQESKYQYIGNWFENSFFWDIKFNKEMVKKLSLQEMIKLNKFGYEMKNLEPIKLNVIKNYILYILFKLLFFIPHQFKIQIFKIGD